MKFGEFMKICMHISALITGILFSVTPLFGILWFFDVITDHSMKELLIYLFSAVFITVIFYWMADDV